MVVAVLCTLLFIMRAILAILPVQFEDLFEIKKDDDTADSEGDTVIFKMDIGSFFFLFFSFDNIKIIITYSLLV